MVSTGKVYFSHRYYLHTYITSLGIELGLYTKVSLGVLLSMVVTVSILGNILVITAIWTDKTLRKVGTLLIEIIINRY